MAYYLIFELLVSREITLIENLLNLSKFFHLVVGVTAEDLPIDLCISFCSLLGNLPELFIKIIIHIGWHLSEMLLE